jgi:hypothetical protein
MVLNRMPAQRRMADETKQAPKGAGNDNDAAVRNNDVTRPPFAVALRLAAIVMFTLGCTYLIWKVRGL